MLYKEYFLLLCLFFSSLLFAQTDKMTIALYDLKPYVVQKKEAAKITERFRYLLGHCNTLQVMVRSEMENILKEKGYKVDRSCDKEKCLLRVGRLLGVDYMASGTIGRVGSSYTISFLMIDIKSGKTVFNEIEVCRGARDRVISKTINKVAIWLAGSIDGIIDKTVLLDTIPTDKVLLDTLPKSTAPKEIASKDAFPTATVSRDFVSPDAVSVDLISTETAKEDTLPQDTFWSDTVTSDTTSVRKTDDSLNVNIDMQELKGTVKVYSHPEGANIIIDDRDFGVTPINIENVSTGKHVIQIKKEGYHTKTETITVSPEEVTEISVQLKTLMTVISVKTNPSNASILINGKNVGKGSVKSYQVPAGKISLQIEAADYEQYDTTFTLATNESKEIKKDLISLYGSLKITSKPSKAQVFLNDKKTGKTPYENDKIDPGNYMLKLKADGCFDIEDNISIVKNESLLKKYTLKFKEKGVKGKKSKKPKRRKIIQNIRRITLGTLTVGFGSAAIWYQLERENALDEHDHDTSDSSKIKRNIFIGLAGVSAIGFGISIPF